VTAPLPITSAGNMHTLKHPTKQTGSHGPTERTPWVRKIWWY